MNFDILIKGGTVVDGSASAGAYRADVGITGDTIEAVGDLRAAEAANVIDAHGKVVAPGFIDMHTHSDFASLIAPTSDSKILSGVTTEVIGQCGASAFPLRGEAYERSVSTFLSSEDLRITWHDVDGYLAEARRLGCSVNRVPMVGHNAIRGSVMGYVDRSPSDAELAQMIREVEIALDRGVFGLSTGLIYPPGCFAKTDEIIALVEPLARAGGLYVSHIRSEGSELERAVDEILDIHQRTGTRIHISHLKCSQRPNWTKIDWLKDRLFAARDAGLDVTADRYPYTASSTGLDTILPKWVYEGTLKDKLDRLSDAHTRERIRQEVLERLTAEDWHDTMVASCEADENRRWEGMRLDEVAREMGLDPFDALCELLIAETGRVQGIFFRMKEENLEEILTWPFVMIGSDGASRNVEKARLTGKPHPRCYGTATRVLGRYVREKGILSLETAVWKLSGFPARRLGLANRGLIAHNVIADVVVFDADVVGDRATYEDPHRYSVGIEHVIVNGVPTVTNGEHTGALAGRLLTRSAVRPRRSAAEADHRTDMDGDALGSH